jgi:hypothetical protein
MRDESQALRLHRRRRRSWPPIWIVEDEHGDLPSIICLVQHVSHTCPIQFLSVGFVPYRDTPNQRCGCTQ